MPSAIFHKVTLDLGQKQKIDIKSLRGFEFCIVRTMSVLSYLSSAVENLGSWEDSARPIAETEGPVYPKVRFNGDLNGYHFPHFSEHFICREELPQGSETFQQVLEEINNEISELDVSDQPKRLPVSNRRKSVATMQTRPSTTREQLKDINQSKDSFKCERKRKISWGKPMFFRSEMTMTSYSRPRVCSEGAVMRRSALVRR